MATGGAERLVPTFARHLDVDRYDLRVACLKEIGGNPMAAELRATGTPLTVLGAHNLRDVRAQKRLLRLVRDEKIDLIHTHLTYADIFGRLAGRLAGRPVVSTLHVPQFFNYTNPSHRDRVIESIATFVRKHFGHTVIAVSEALRRYHISRGLPASRVVTIHNGIELEKFRLPSGFSRESLREGLGIPPGAPVVVTLAVLREGKGHDLLLSAARSVLRHFPEARFLIVGGGPLENELRQRAESSGLSGRVVFTGMRRDVAEMLSLADLFVLPSQFDPLPTVVLEAMSMRLPVVGLDSGGVPEMVLHEQTGLLLPAPDGNALAEAILSLLADPERARGMGERGRKRVEAEFSAETWVSKVEDLYEEFLGARRKESPRVGGAS